MEERCCVLTFYRVQDSDCVELRNMKVLPEEVVKSDSRQH